MKFRVTLMRDRGVRIPTKELGNRESFVGELLKPPTNKARHDVGGRLRYSLAPLLANIADAIEAEDREQQQFLAELRKSFSSSEWPRWDVKPES